MARPKRPNRTDAALVTTFLKTLGDQFEGTIMIAPNGRSLSFQLVIPTTTLAAGIRAAKEQS